MFARFEERLRGATSCRQPIKFERILYPEAAIMADLLPVKCHKCAAPIKAGITAIFSKESGLKCKCARHLISAAVHFNQEMLALVLSTLRYLEGGRLQKLQRAGPRCPRKVHPWK